jgi:hypothetical protein
MSKFIKPALINVSAVLLLTACGPNEKYAQQAGFTSVAEMKDLQAKGFKTKDDYAKANGWDSLKQMEEGQKLGFKNSKDMKFLTERGFRNKQDFIEYKNSRPDSVERVIFHAKNATNYLSLDFVEACYANLAALKPSMLKVTTELKYKAMLGMYESILLAFIGMGSEKESILTNIDIKTREFQSSSIDNSTSIYKNCLDKTLPYFGMAELEAYND